MAESRDKEIDKVVDEMICKAARASGLSEDVIAGRHGGDSKEAVEWERRMSERWRDRTLELWIPVADASGFQVWFPIIVDPHHPWWRRLWNWLRGRSNREKYLVVGTEINPNGLDYLKVIRG